MSDFLKLAYELISQIVYYLVEWIVGIFGGFVKLFITGWASYISIFASYFGHFSLPLKILAILLALLLIAIPVVIIVLIVRLILKRIRLRMDKVSSTELYKEIGRLNRQVLGLIEEKNKILAMKVNAMGGREKIPYMGASALIDDEVPTVGNVVGVTPDENGAAIIGGVESGKAVGVVGAVAVAGGAAIGDDTISNAASAAAQAAAQAKAKVEAEEQLLAHRFPKLSMVDAKYRDAPVVVYDNEITLEEFTENYRKFAASNLNLYYTQEIVRRFVAGMAASKILILEGISGTGKTSLPYSFGRYLNNPATLVSVQPSFRDRTELIGYFNEFSKRFNETEFLRAMYEADYRPDPSFIVLDEMNLARIEYYFAEMLSVLEMPSQDEWVLDLVPTAWPGDPVKLEGGKIHVPDSLWFVGTANNDDSTFTITDKVYDRAIPIELNQRTSPFECEMTPSCNVTAEHLQQMFIKAIDENPISPAIRQKLEKLDTYLQTRFKMAFGNRIMKQMEYFVPVYVACGGTELGAMDYIIARKVLKKFESMNVSFVRDEIKDLIVYIEKTFGRTAMADSKEYLRRIQNLY